MSDSLVKNSGTADSLLKDTVLSGLRELAADSAGHLPDSVRGKVAIPDSIGAAVTDSLQADSVAEDTAKVPIIGAPFGKIHTGILTLLGNCYFQLILLAIFQ